MLARIVATRPWYQRTVWKSVDKRDGLTLNVMLARNCDLILQLACPWLWSAHLAWINYAVIPLGHVWDGRSNSSPSHIKAAPICLHALSLTVGSNDGWPCSWSFIYSPLSLSFSPPLSVIHVHVHPQLVFLYTDVWEEECKLRDSCHHSLSAAANHDIAVKSPPLLMTALEFTSERACISPAEMRMMVSAGNFWNWPQFWTTPGVDAFSVGPSFKCLHM